ncbi:hypothetical protein PSP31121_04833 [Pandoraea sputorum]|uniref:Uncharacterized protein n=1 Tax=Pandoraea sputorum TaxID=93222 RepID=A0A5E5BEI4_9BURK|nr:hypothetical protein PSP31121_04833 [Pandoraea sputorum]
MPALLPLRSPRVTSNYYRWRLISNEEFYRNRSASAATPDPRSALGHIHDPAVPRTFYKSMPIVSDSPSWIHDAV